MVRIVQGYPNSCGAASLLCAAVELGVTNFPDASILIASPFCENVIYGQIGTGKPGTPLRERGYSMPAQIGALARTLGLGVDLYMQPGFYSTMLGTFYASAVEDARKAGFAIHAAAPPAVVGDGYRDLMVMAVMKVLGLHYVMRRADGTYMDPGDGIDGANFAAINNSWTKSYSETGISIRLTRP